MLTHGHTKGGKCSKTYLAWRNARQRCYNPHNENYPRYGGRGIRVCARWRSFIKFLADMGEAPAGMTLDRKNNDGDYNIGNCEWTTRRDNVRNSTVSKYLTFQGVRMRLGEWEQAVGLRQGTLGRRLLSGWPVEAALFEPTQTQFIRRQQ